MVRLGVVLLCALLALTAAAQLALGHPLGWFPIGIEAALVGVIVAFERGRYRPDVNPLRGTWRPTGERFRDPTSGEVVDVYADQQSGKRDYRPAGRSS
jgi:hypothetical protein